MNFGAGFLGCLDYITGKYDKDKHAKILAHSMGIPDMDNRTVALIFESYARKGGHDIQNPVGHFAYSFHPNDQRRMTDEFMLKIMHEHMEMLGIKDTEWIFTRHYDTAHEHGHLMFSMVDNHGNAIDDSMIYARNKRICKYLTKKYGLTMSSEKDKVNRSKLRGKDKWKYEFYDKVMKCKLQSSNWREFDDALRAVGLKLRFHYNNVTGKLMGVAFTDGKVSFSGNKLDPELKLESLQKEFGDIRQIVHSCVHEWYEDYQVRLCAINDWEGYKNLMKVYPEWDKMFPDDRIPDFNYLSVAELLSPYNDDFQARALSEFTPSENEKSGYFSLNMLVALFLQPYVHQISMGGGGGNNQGWRDFDDEDKRKYKFRINYNNFGRKPRTKSKR